MITLFTFGSAFGLPDASPFVLKIDAYLRFTGLEYETKSSLKNLQIAPKGKLPFIKDGDDIIADSSFIMEYLEKKHALKIDQHLTAEQRAQAHFISKSIEESLYWCGVYFRWIDEKNWPIVKHRFFSKMPFPLNIIAPIVARKGIIKSMHSNGMGRHSEDELLVISKNHFEALSTLLGNKRYCFNDKISSIDATIYAFLAALLLADLTSPLSELGKSYDNLMKYCERIHSDYYS